jgi:phosphatidylglycerol:prolipoprotein diacylglycerol transferase
MTEQPLYPETWGIRPILFQTGNIGIQSYPVLISLAIITGVLVYYREARRMKNFSENSFYIVLAALVGGALGSKIPVWIMNYKIILQNLPDISLLLSGRTILGGMIGGSVAVAFIKWKLHIKQRIGNQIAPAAAIGMAIGRIGCFLRGCCYGIPTHLPWGVDFGDGIPRFPTQLLDGLFNLVLFIYLMKIRDKVTEPGKLFRIYLLNYFTFRFLTGFIREEVPVLLGLTPSQLVSIIALAYMNRNLVLKYLQRKEVTP